MIKLIYFKNKIFRFKTKINFIKIFLYILFFELSNEKLFSKLNLISEITITINGAGNQAILSDDTYCFGTLTPFSDIPTQILVNGIPQNYSGKIVYNLTNQINIITMIWNYTLSNCNLMFSGLINITKFDFSKFDSSNVTDMKCMFSGYTSLKSLNLTSFNTSLVNDMSAMFSGCRSLETIDLSSFVTSSVYNMQQMFRFCNSLKSLDLSNFDTSNVNDMTCMFDECYSLIKLNLKNFYINSYSVCNNNMFKDFVFGIYCFSVNITSKCRTNFYSFMNNNCSNVCFQNSQSKLIIEKYTCIDNCTKDDQYQFEYNSICYESCPKGTHNSLNNYYLCEEDLLCNNNYYNYKNIECLDYIPEGFYLKDSIYKTIDKCNIKCKSCSREN